jgi:deoxyribonuclease IV
MVKRAETDEPSGRDFPLIGAQISTAGGFVPVPGRAHAIGAEAVQVFASNPRMWRPRTPSAEELDEFRAGLRHYGLPLFFHAIYLINLATPDEELRARSVEALAYSLTLGGLAGAAGVVTHLGSHRGEGFDKGCMWAVEAVGRARQMATESLASGSDGQERSLPPLLFETGPGGGASLGGRLEEIAQLLEALDGGGVCIDTAHLFAAGYPIHKAEGLDGVIEELRALGLLHRLGLVHLNDSSTPFASNWDRHDNPGDGQIGYEGLAQVVRHPALAHLPFVLETPGLEGHGPDAANIEVVKSMRESKPGTARHPA